MPVHNSWSILQAACLRAPVHLEHRPLVKSKQICCFGLSRRSGEEPALCM